MNELTGAELFFKCENFQKAGAFKVRGAIQRVSSACPTRGKKGVATHSSGNHALSLSYAAGRRGIPVQRRDAPHRARGQKGRRARLWRHDHECEPSTTSREEVFAEVQPAPAAISCIPTTTRA
jgi:threonine dehydratase